MIRYEVTVTIPEGLSGDFEHYMVAKHIPEVMETGRFRCAEFCRGENGSYRTSYVAPDRESLDEYLSKDAGRLRDAFLREFPHEAKVERNVLEVMRSWDPD